MIPMIFAVCDNVDHKTQRILDLGYLSLMTFFQELEFKYTNKMPVLHGTSIIGRTHTAIVV